MLWLYSGRRFGVTQRAPLQWPLYAKSKTAEAPPSLLSQAFRRPQPQPDAFFSCFLTITFWKCLAFSHNIYFHQHILLHWIPSLLCSICFLKTQNSISEWVQSKSVFSPVFSNFIFLCLVHYGFIVLFRHSPLPPYLERSALGCWHSHFLP